MVVESISIAWMDICNAALRTAEAKTAREIRNCLKRYIARELYRQLNQSMKPLTNP